MNKSVVTIAASVALSALAAYGVAKVSNMQEGGSYDNPSVLDSSRFRTVNLQETDYPDFTYAAETCVDAVVYVEVSVKQQMPDYSSDPFYRFFYGDAQPRQRESKGSGSGVIIREDGYIVTNNHVVANASTVKVTLTNNMTYDATVIGTDPATDVALLKVDAQGLPSVLLGNSDELRLGEWVIAIGSPYGLRSTITAGIVSAKGRSMASNEKDFKIESFIQTDAAVNPGNSGGALVNKKGELVGINTMIYSQTGSYAGYSFAVPVNIVRKIIADLIDFGSVKRAMLGVTMQAIDEKLAKELKLSTLSGVYINEVSGGSSADKAGVKKGDVLKSIDDVVMKDMATVQEKVNSYRPGDEAELVVIRDGKEKKLNVVFQAAAAETGSVSEDGSVAFYGAQIKDASKETLERLKLKQGVEVVSVGQGKLREEGVSDGYVILYVNDRAVKSAKDVVEIAKNSKRAIYIEGVTKDGRPTYFAFGKDE